MRSRIPQRRGGKDRTSDVGQWGSIPVDRGRQKLPHAASVAGSTAHCRKDGLGRMAVRTDGPSRNAFRRGGDRTVKATNTRVTNI